MVEILTKYKYDLPKSTRNNLRMVTQIISGTSILKYSSAIRKKSRSPYCKYCKNIRETSEHFLTECTQLNNARLHCFGKVKTNIKEIIRDRKWGEIIEYIKYSNRFQWKKNRDKNDT
jgi:hypothetical protein